MSDPYTVTTLPAIARARKLGVRLAATSPLTDTTMRVGPIIAEFACARDAQLFAALKRESGEQVTVVPGVALLLAVRSMVTKL